MSWWRNFDEFMICLHILQSMRVALIDSNAFLVAEGMKTQSGVYGFARILSSFFLDKMRKEQ